MENKLIEDEKNLEISNHNLKEKFIKSKKIENALKTIFILIFITIFVLFRKKIYLYNKNIFIQTNKGIFKSFLQSESPKNKKILVIGSIGYDLTTYYEKMPVIGETIVGRKFGQNPGGKGDNQAVAAARAGGDVTFIGAVGDDNYENILKKNLDDNNVKHNLKVVPNMSCQIATILVDKNGQNSIIIVPGANDFIDKKQIDDNEKLIDENDIILMQLEIPIETVEYAIDIAYKKNKIIILNPAPGQPLSDNILKKVGHF